MIKAPPEYTPQELKGLQKRTGLTNKAFAEALGVTQRTWENMKFNKQKRPLPLIKRRALANLETSISDTVEYATGKMGGVAYD